MVLEDTNKHENENKVAGAHKEHHQPAGGPACRERLWSCGAAPGRQPPKCGGDAPLQPFTRGQGGVNQGRPQRVKSSGRRRGWGEEEEYCSRRRKSTASPPCHEAAPAKATPPHSLRYPRPGGADRAPFLRLAAAAALEMPLFAEPPPLPAHPQPGSRTAFMSLFWTAAHPAPCPSADSFPPPVPPGMGGRYLLAIVARGKAMTRIAEGGRWERAEPNGITGDGLPGAGTARGGREAGGGPPARRRGPWPCH